MLVVEDSKNIRKLMAARLEQEGDEVIQAEDGNKALDVLESQQVDLDA
ncbi:hypothetical protein [Clostridium sp. SHJSY1]|nr:hypothetical protein [Clostridium sp. SHJSY1]